MNTHGRILALVGIAALSQAHAAPMMALSDNAEIFITATAGIKIDDNIYLDTNNKQDDVIFTAKPGFDLVFGRNAQTSGNLYYTEEFLKYADNTNQDTSLSSVGANALYSNGKTKFDTGASYAQVAQNDNDIRASGSLVRRELISLRAVSEFAVTEKTVVGAGANYAITDYVPASFSDSDILTIPLDAYFAVTPKLEASVGYRYRSTDLSGGGIDNNDHFLNVGARGEFTPKLSGQVRIGYQQRDFDSGSDEDQLAIDSSLTLAYSEKTSFQIGLSNDFGSSGVGDSTKNSTISLSTNTKLDEQWSWNAGLSFKKSKYPTRTDDFIQGNAGLRYTLTSYLNLEATYAYQDNASTLASSEFTGNAFGISANIRY